MEQFEDVLLFILCRFYKEPFIEDEEDGIGILGHHFAVGAVIPRSLKIDEQIRKPNILGIVVVFTCLHPERTSHVAFATACGSGDEDVPVIGDVLTSGKPLDQILVELAPGCIIDIRNAGRGLVKLGVLDETLQPVILPASILTSFMDGLDS